MHPLLTDTIRARAASALTTQTTMDGRTARQHWRTPEERDAYVARATRAGAIVEIVTAAD